MPPTSFPPSLTPCQALQLEAMATGPKQLEKSLREPTQGVKAATNPKARARALGRSEKHQKEEALIPARRECWSLAKGLPAPRDTDPCPEGYQATSCCPCPLSLQPETLYI